jgi:hypothetical protein
MENDLLQRGIAALKAGDKAEARRLLGRIIRQNPRDEQAWLWMSGAVDTARERATCLTKVLEINPQNETARRGLTTLKKRLPTTPAPPVETQPVPQPQHIRPSLVQSILSGNQSSAQSVFAPAPNATAASGQTPPPASFNWSNALAPKSSQDTSHLINHDQTLEQMSPESRKALEGYTQLIIYELSDGKAKKEIIERLVKRGFSKAAVKQLVEQVAKTKTVKQARRKRLSGLPIWAWPFVVACGIMVIFPGGLIAGAIGGASAAGCAVIAQSSSWSVLIRVVICIALAIGAWILAIFISGAVYLLLQ